MQLACGSEQKFASQHQQNLWVKRSGPERSYKVDSEADLHAKNDNRYRWTYLA